MLYAVSRTGANLGIRPASAAVSIKYSALDLADSSSMTSLAVRVKKDQGGCDVLINNAGLYHYAQNPTTEQRREMVDINYRGTLMVGAFFFGSVGWISAGPKCIRSSGGSQRLGWSDEKCLIKC